MAATVQEIRERDNAAYAKWANTPAVSQAVLQMAETIWRDTTIKEKKVGYTTARIKKDAHGNIAIKSWSTLVAVYVARYKTIFVRDWWSTSTAAQITRVMQENGIVNRINLFIPSGEVIYQDAKGAVIRFKATKGVIPNVKAQETGAVTNMLNAFVTLNNNWKSVM